MESNGKLPSRWYLITEPLSLLWMQPYVSAVEALHAYTVAFQRGGMGLARHNTYVCSAPIADTYGCIHIIEAGGPP